MQDEMYMTNGKWRIIALKIWEVNASGFLT